MESREEVLKVLSDGKPKSAKELVYLIGLGDRAIEGVFRRMWKSNLSFILV